MSTLSSIPTKPYMLGSLKLVISLGFGVSTLETVWLSRPPRGYEQLSAVWWLKLAFEYGYIAFQLNLPVIWKKEYKQPLLSLWLSALTIPSEWLLSRYLVGICMLLLDWVGWQLGATVPTQGNCVNTWMCHYCSQITKNSTSVKQLIKSMCSSLLHLNMVLWIGLGFFNNIIKVGDGLGWTSTTLLDHSRQKVSC